jgi:hypothetical protein
MIWEKTKESFQKWWLNIFYINYNLRTQLYNDKYNAVSCYIDNSLSLPQSSMNLQVNLLSSTAILSRVVNIIIIPISICYRNFSTTVWY